MLLQGRRLHGPSYWSLSSFSLPLSRPLSTAHASVRDGREEKKERPWRHVQPAEDISRFMRGGGDGKSGAMFDSYGRKHNYLRISLTERCNLRFVVILTYFYSDLSLLCFFALPCPLHIYS